MEKSHTPGPWHIMEKPDGGVDITKSPNGYHIAQMLFTGYPGDVVSNARLIAAAPELLAALEQMRLALLPVVTATDAQGNDRWPAIADATIAGWAAIAKARG